MEAPLVEDHPGVEAHRAAVEDHRVEARLFEDHPVEEEVVEVEFEGAVHHHTHYILHTWDLQNHSTHTTTLQHPCSTQAYVHFAMVT